MAMFLLAVALARLWRAARLRWAARAEDAPTDPRLADDRRMLGSAIRRRLFAGWTSISRSVARIAPASRSRYVCLQIKSDYIRQGGRSISSSMISPLHEISLRAALIARCAPPDRYVAMIETLFRVQQGWVLQNPGESLDALKQQAKFAGMSTTTQTRCLPQRPRAFEDGMLKAQLSRRPRHCRYQRDADLHLRPEARRQARCRRSL